LPFAPSLCTPALASSYRLQQLSRGGKSTHGNSIRRCRHLCQEGRLREGRAPQAKGDSRTAHSFTVQRPPGVLPWVCARHKLALHAAEHVGEGGREHQKRGGDMRGGRCERGVRRGVGRGGGAECGGQPRQGQAQGR
ncbi:unnamed protein product, partial [Musa hybrid cultivar]